MKNIKLAVAALALGAFAFSAVAQTATPNIDKRQAEQQKRIDQGVKSGQLTDKEAVRLNKGQAKVQKMEDKAKADGVVTAKERQRIEREQNKKSRNIAREKHDKQKK